MDTLVDGMASLSGMRDRDALDAAAVRLVLEHVGRGVVGARLLRIVGDPPDQRCLVRAQMRSGQTEVQADPVWVDWSTLDALGQHPLRHSAFSNSNAQWDEERAVFVLVGERGPWGLLEVDSTQTLTAAQRAVVDAILRTYQNVLGLLDYGEKDALTELLNRKTFDGAFFRATTAQQQRSADAPERRAAADGGNYWLAVLDIDHFKRVNDTFGHLIGDEVLLLVARIMRNSFRFYDQLYRFGGEEFVILMRCKDETDALHALERLRTNVESYGFPQVGTITVSLGFSRLQEHDTPSAAFGRADKAVYYAKEHGRNQVVSYQTLLDTGVVKEETTDMDVDLF
ncbi:MAG: GGDEF domain-containing protein [Rhodoferax sp.]